MPFNKKPKKEDREKTVKTITLKLKTGKHITLGKVLLSISLIIILTLAVYLTVPIKKCYDRSCFNSEANRCRASSFLNKEEGNLIQYAIKGPRWRGCLLEIKIIDTNSIRTEFLEGKKMTCIIPFGQKVFLEDVGGILDYCSGPLKEGLYEVLLERMTTLITKELANVTAEMEKVLEQAEKRYS